MIIFLWKSSRVFAGIPVEDKVNIFINSFGSIQETTMVSVCVCVCVCVINLYFIFHIIHLGTQSC